jgi:TolB protein
VLLFAVSACPPPTVTKKKAHDLGVTGAGQALSRITSELVDELWPSISPDGSIVLFDVSVGDLSNPRERTIVGVDPNTGARRTLYTSTTSFAEQTAWLPDNSSFVYTSNSPGSWSLVKALSNTPNAAVTVIVNGEVAPKASRPTLSPDGKRIAFSTQIRGTWTIAVAGIDGSRFTLLGEGMNPAWEPSGTRLAFHRVVNGKSQLFLVNADSGTDLVQLSTGENDNFNASWSPDARFLVFSSNRGWNTRPGGSEYGTGNLFIVSPDGTGLTQLTDGDGMANFPNWGADGWIYFSSNQAGDSFDIWRVRTVGDFAAGAPAT